MYRQFPLPSQPSRNRNAVLFILLFPLRSNGVSQERGLAPLGSMRRYLRATFLKYQIDS